jgi:phenylalanyl-tRNA synthetase alpha chain
VDLASFSSQLDDLSRRALAAVAAADDPQELDDVESSFLGRKGELRELLGGIGKLPAEDRPKVGALANPIRENLEREIATRRTRLNEIALEVRLARERTDVTLPGRPLPVGSLHPLIETQREIARIFGQFGFVVFESPEVETDEINFQLLNIPADHPARDLWDTIYVEPPADNHRDADDNAGASPRYLLRTHTSPGQIRLMRASPPPIRAVLPGRCYRYEAVDASHGFEFYQVEGLMIDEGTSMATLRGLLDEFAHAMFGADKATRFRPGYYPFTEPSVAFDISCTICGGVGCPACRRTGWLTILGAGMVHPVVLRNGGIDPERYQGFAFGMGVDRIAMLRHGIPDIRAFFDNDLRFLGKL